MMRMLCAIVGACFRVSWKDFNSDRGAMLGTNAMPMLATAANATMQSKTKGAIFVTSHLRTTYSIRRGPIFVFCNMTQYE